MSTKTYTVKEFCKKYNDVISPEIKSTFVNSIINSHYIPYEMKITICEKIVENSYYITTEKNGVKSKKLHSNSPMRHMLYCLNMVKYYTYLEIDFSNSLEEFNLLNKCDLLYAIYSCIPEKEINEFKMILDMVENDILQNEYEVYTFISNQVERLGELFGYIIKPAINRFSDVVKNMDENTIDKMIGKLKGMNGKLNIMK